MGTQVGIVSDSHDHLPNLRHALDKMIERGVRTVIHCGDLIAPFVTVELAKFELAVHTVFGNNDGDRFLHAQLAAEAAPNVIHHGELGVIELEDRRLAFCHYEDGARGLARRSSCQAAFYGHTHEHDSGRDDGELLALNPGELLGMKAAPSFCLYDLQSGEVERCAFETQPWPKLAPND